ncbi:MAG TPA: threonine ammonia-lyase, biosynthetic [Vicinamibacterales bacterium]|nr:threonine ammonia-lyase, biosynthetic [Vicinamibacterales bacterium]
MTADALLRLILNSRVYDVALQTPLDPARLLSQRTGHHVFLKREDLQPIFTYKIRGAYNRIAHFSPEERQRGVIAASAGNHAQGVAFAARHLGLDALIVMPLTTPPIKIDAVRRLGAGVELAGDSFSEAQVRSDEIAVATGRTLVHPFDDPLVIAGQGTIAQEILAQGRNQIDAIFVPIGGGGLVAGVAGYVKSVNPAIKVIGVEPYDADAMYQSWKAGRRVALDRVGIFADGVAVREVGELTFEIARNTVDDIVRVSNDQICAAIKDVFDDTRSLMEPAGALAVAGLQVWASGQPSKGSHLVAILSGANMNFDRLRFVAERAEVGEAREALFGVTIPERPGAFRAFCAAIGRRVVTEFNYRLSGRHAAHIFVGIGIASRRDAEELIGVLAGRGYPAVDLSDDELAKLHVRYMVGGRSADVRNERLYRFEFPERPGALMEFLERLGDRWNISLFHYRNHGSDFGRVLAGFEVPAGDGVDFERFLGALGYACEREADNPAYAMFLAGA